MSVFCWDMFDEKADQVCIHLSRSTEGAAKPDFALLTPAGETYNELTRWLVGARMMSKTVVDLPAGGQRWAIQIERGNGYHGATRELQRREKLKEAQSEQAKGSGETADTQETSSPQESGKGTQVDKKA